MVSNEMLVPSTSFVGNITKEAEKEVPKMEEEARALLEMVQSEGWIVLKKYVEEKKKRLLAYTQESVRSRQYEFQNIGFAFLLYDQIGMALSDVIKFAESPLEVAKAETDSGEEVDDDL